MYVASGVLVSVFRSRMHIKFALYWLPFVYLGSTLLPISGRAGRNMYDGPGSTVPAITNFYLVDSVLALSPDGLIDAIAHLLMPALTLSFVTMALITRMMRSSMLEVMNQEYIKTARSKGLSEKVVVKKH